MKIISVVGTRPEFIKMAPFFREAPKYFTHNIIHTKQHYDPEMDKEIIKDLKIPKIKFQLRKSAQGFGNQISSQIKQIYNILSVAKPDYVLVQGDTNSSLAGAIAAARLKIAVVHVEAGCRSFNLGAPEEQNRRIIDSISTIFFCADKKSMGHLQSEGKQDNLYYVGSTVLDSVNWIIKNSNSKYTQTLGLKKKGYGIITLHRAENMSDKKQFIKKIEFLNNIAKKIDLIFPVHPRTQKFIKTNKIIISDNIKLLPPLSYIKFISLLRDSKVVFTDSGGIQEESAFVNIPCLILRSETEWTRLIKAKKNFLLPSLSDKEIKFTYKLIENNIFYKTVANRKATEMALGATNNIIKYLKEIHNK